MKAELFIGWRYLSTKRKEKFISLISVISILGIAIGVMSLIVVIAVMSGFDKDLRERIIGSNSHITVTSYDGISSQDLPFLLEKIESLQSVKGSSPYLQGQVLIKKDKSLFGVNLKGIDSQREPSVTKLKEYIFRGRLEDLKPGGIIIGKELAAYLGLNIGSKVEVYSSAKNKQELEVRGIFNSGMYDYDMSQVVVDMPTAGKILESSGKVTAIAVKLDDPHRAISAADELGALLGPGYISKTWIEVYPNFFAALKLEKLVMFIILTLIILVASFNIISMLTVTVVEKTKDIGILKAIGMSPQRIRNIFVYQGFLLGALGTFLGAGAGIGLCVLLDKYQFIKLPQDIYYIDHLPVSLRLWPDFILITCVAMLISLISTIYPAVKASGLEPVEALRYE